MKQDPKYLAYLKFSSLGLEMGLAIIAGLWIGQWFDQYFKTAPWGQILWLAAGFGAAFKAIWRALKNLQKAQQEQEKNDNLKRPH